MDIGTMPPINLPAVVTPSFLSSIRGHPQLPRQSWYFIAGVTLSVLNRPDEIPKLFTFALDNGVDPATNARLAHTEQLQVARRLREGLVKSAAIVGLPKVCRKGITCTCPVQTLDLRGLIFLILSFDR